MKKKKEKTGIIAWLDSIPIGIGKDRNYLVENLSMLVASGMNMLTAIEAISQEVRSRSMKKILGRMADDIAEGYPLWRTLERSKIFREHTVSLVRIGEESGRLSDNLRLIAEQEEKDRAFRSKLRSAMMYPLFVLGLTVIIGIAISWFILPRLATVFSSINVELPTITRWLITFGEFLGEYGYIAVPIFVVGLVLVLYFVFGFPKTKFIGQTLLFWTPGIKGLLREVELARFTYLLGTLLKAGIPVTHALNSIHQATTFRQYSKLYAHIRDSVEMGNSFQKSFASYKGSRRLIPIPIQQLVIAAEQSGNLSDALVRISHSYEERTENTTKNLTVILEPILLVVVWIGVVGVALAVILPIYSLIGGLNVSPEERIQQRTEGSAVEEDDADEPGISLEDVKKAVEDEPDAFYLEILPTGIGYLNVRDADLIEGEVIATVTPGDVYEYVGEREGWYEIVLEDETTGWVTGEYVTFVEETEE